MTKRTRKIETPAQTKAREAQRALPASLIALLKDYPEFPNFCRVENRVPLSPDKAARVEQLLARQQEETEQRVSGMPKGIADDPVGIAMFEAQIRPKAEVRAEQRAERASTSPKKPSKPRATRDGLTSIADIAAQCSMTAKQARGALRAAKEPKPDCGWAFKSDQVERIKALCIKFEGAKSTGEKREKNTKPTDMGRKEKTRFAQGKAIPPDVAVWTGKASKKSAMAIPKQQKKPDEIKAAVGVYKSRQRKLSAGAQRVHNKLIASKQRKLAKKTLKSSSATKTQKQQARKLIRRKK